MVQTISLFKGVSVMKRFILTRKWTLCDMMKSIINVVVTYTDDKKILFVQFLCCARIASNKHKGM